MHIPECEQMLSEIEEDWLEYQSHQKAIREEYEQQTGGLNY